MRDCVASRAGDHRRQGGQEQEQAGSADRQNAIQFPHLHLLCDCASVALGDMGDIWATRLLWRTGTAVEQTSATLVAQTATE